MQISKLISLSTPVIHFTENFAWSKEWIGCISGGKYSEYTIFSLYSTVGNVMVF